MENNVKIFYEKKELYETVSKNLIHNSLFYSYQKDGQIVIEVNQELSPELRKIDRLETVLEIIKDVIEGKRVNIGTRTIEILNKAMEDSKKKAMEDFGIKIEEGK
jgi:hypothetical protein